MNRLLINRKIKSIAAGAGLAALLAGCATTLETGPGYYRYDTHIAGTHTPTVVATEPVTVYREPAVVYQEPAVVYHDAAVVRTAPARVYRGPLYGDRVVVYRDISPSLGYTDHGQ
jgi:hypothetical protein